MTLKAVLIVGPRNNEILNSSQIKSLYSQPGYLIIGDGNMQPVYLEEILSLLKGNIDSNTRIDIYAHGAPYPQNKDLLSIQLGWDKNDDNAESIFTLLKEVNDSRPLNLHIWSCHSGLANKSLKYLPEGSLLFTHVSGDVTAFDSLCVFALIHSVQEWSNTLEEIPHRKFLKSFLNSFAYDSIEGSSVATWGYQEPEPQEYVLNVMPTLKEVLMDPVKVLNEKLDHYIEFCKESFGLTDLTIPDLSEFAETFKLGYFLHNCAHGRQEEVVSIVKELELPKPFFEQHLNHFTPLQAAIAGNQEKIVEFLLKEKKVLVDLNDLLWEVINGGRINILSILHECGADLNAPIFHDNTPLAVAISCGQNEILEFLLKHGAIWDYEKLDPFTRAIQEGNLDTLKFLLDFESLEDQSTKYGFTKLYKAVLSQDKEVIKAVLKDDNSQVNQADHKGNTPLHVATRLRDNETVKLLLEHQADPNEKNERSGSTPFHLATSNGDTNITAMLLNYGAKPEIQNKFDYTALHFAVANGHKEIVELLLSTPGYQSYLNKLSDHGTALSLAIREGHDEIAKLLIDVGADFTIPHPDGQTLLHKAVQDGNIKIVKLLIDKGEDPNQKNRESYPLLYSAAIHSKSAELVKFLLEKGADPTVKFGTIIESITQNDFYFPEAAEIIALLQKAVSDKMNDQQLNCIYNLAKLGDQESISALKANINQQNDLGYTALHLAAQEGNLEMINLLISLGANTCSKDKSGEIPLRVAINGGNTNSALLLIPSTPLGVINIKTDSVLHLAAKKGNIVIVKALIDAGADINNISYSSLVEHTPLSTAATYGHKDVVELLIEHNANVNQLNGLGTTALYEAACYNKYVEVVRLLLERGADPSIKCRGTNVLDALKTGYKSTSFDCRTIVELIEKAMQDKAQGNADVSSADQEITSTSGGLELANIQTSNESQEVMTQLGIVKDTEGEIA